VAYKVAMGINQVIPKVQRTSGSFNPPTTVGPEFIALDWEHPVFFGISEVLPQLTSLKTWPDLDFFNQLAMARGHRLTDGRPVSFVHQPKKPGRWRRRRGPKLRYEESVLERAVIPSRSGSLHDFFNNISWLVFFNAKLALVERLAAAGNNRTAYDIERGQFRSREGDRLAMLDEGGLLRFNQGRIRYLVFGHALQESFVEKNLEVCSLTLSLNLDSSMTVTELISKSDAHLAALIRSGFFALDTPEFNSTCLRELDQR